MNVQSGKPEVAINLECGSSLAELEYTTELDQEQRHHEEKKDDQDFTSEKLSIQQKIDVVRSSLSNDVVTVSNNDNGSNGAGDSSSISMFTSPFETPKAHKSSGQTDIPEAERYAAVPLIYCDQTASNRPLKSIEKFIHENCLPMYGNTHTNTSVTGSQSTAFVAEARQIVAEGVNAKISGKAALDVVLFA
jgi:hypothetical protein